MKRREAKSKGEKERYKHLNAEFQRIARRAKKAFLSDQCKEIFEGTYYKKRTSLVTLMVKHLPTTWETWVQSLGWEDLLEKKMATHSSVLAWKIPGTEEPGRLQSMGLQRVGHD